MHKPRSYHNLLYTSGCSFGYTTMGYNAPSVKTANPPIKIAVFILLDIMSPWWSVTTSSKKTVLIIYRLYHPVAAILSRNQWSDQRYPPVCHVVKDILVCPLVYTVPRVLWELVFSFFSREKCQRTVTLGAFLTSLLMMKEVSGWIFYLCKFSIRVRHVFLNYASYKLKHSRKTTACQRFKIWEHLKVLKTRLSRFFLSVNYLQIFGIWGGNFPKAC